MVEYSIVIRPEVFIMLDVIYKNICDRAIDNSVAQNVIDSIENTILSLKTLPERGSNVVTGMYANKGYRKLIVKSHIIIYKVLQIEKKVVIVFVKPEKMNT